jgi:hypothetical protein
VAGGKSNYSRESLALRNPHVRLLAKRLGNFPPVTPALAHPEK